MGTGCPVWGLRPRRAAGSERTYGKQEKERPRRPDARQDHRRIFKQLPPDVPHNHEHNPFGFHRAHFQSLRYVLDKIFFGRFGSHSQQHLLS